MITPVVILLLIFATPAIWYAVTSIRFLRAGRKAFERYTANNPPQYTAPPVTYATNDESVPRSHRAR